MRAVIIGNGGSRSAAHQQNGGYDNQDKAVLFGHNYSPFFIAG